MQEHMCEGSVKVTSMGAAWTIPGYNITQTCQHGREAMQKHLSVSLKVSEGILGVIYR